MSKYKTGEITLEGVTKAAKMLKDAFPQLEKGFYDILLDRVREYEFTDNKLIDAVKYVIDTCKYPQPTISSIISYDRQIRLYTHDQMIEMMKYDDNIFNKCKIFKPNENKIFYYKK